MTRWVCVTLSLAALVVGTWWFASRHGAQVDLAPAAHDEPDARDVPDGPDSRIAFETAADPLAAAIVGRCVDADSRAPLAGAQLLLTGRTPPGEEGADVETVAWSPVRARSAGDGRFLVAFVPPATPFAFELLASHAECGWLRKRWPAVARGARIDLGDIPLRRGAKVRGRLLDTRERPQAGVELVFESREREATGAMEAAGAYRTRTNGDGAFGTPVLAAGRYRVVADGRRLRSPAEVTVVASRQPVELGLVVWGEEDHEVISGVVVDEGGTPCGPGIEVELVPGLRRSHRDRTDDEGRFRFLRAPDQPRGPQQLKVVSEPGWASLPDDHAFEWKTQDVRLVARRLPQVEVRITDAITGELVPCRLSHEHDPDQLALFHDWELEMARECDGTTLLTAAPGWNVLLAVPKDRTRHPFPGVRHFEMTERGAPVQHIELQPTVTQRVVVVRRSGAPVAGTRLRLSCTTDRVRDVYVSELLTTQETRTDERGEAVLTGPAATRLALEVTGPGHAPNVRTDLVLPATETTLRVVVDDGATLRVSLEPPAALAHVQPWTEDGKVQRPSLSLFDFSTGKPPIRFHPPEAAHGLAFDEGGRLELHGVPPGKWMLVLHAADRPGAPRGSEHVQRDLVVSGNETLDVVLDVAHRIPGTLRATVLHDGAPLRRAGVRLAGTHARGGWRLRDVTARTDGEGRLTAELPAGLWRVACALPDQETVFFPLREHVWSAEHLATTSGAATDGTFHLGSARARVRLVQPDGKPLAWGFVVIRAPGEPWFEEIHETDDRGWFEIAAPPFAVTLVAVLGERELKFDTVTLPANGEVELRAK